VNTPFPPFFYFKMERNNTQRTFRFVNLNAESNMFNGDASNRATLRFVPENTLEEFVDHAAIQREQSRETLELNEREVQEPVEEYILQY
jgi:hypothetical protein